MLSLLAFIRQRQLSFRSSLTLVLRRVVFWLGLLLILLSLISLAGILVPNGQLSQYGHGYMAGKILLLLIGVAMAYWGRKK